MVAGAAEALENGDGEGAGAREGRGAKIELAEEECHGSVVEHSGGRGRGGVVVEEEPGKAKRGRFDALEGPGEIQRLELAELNAGLIGIERRD